MVVDDYSPVVQGDTAALFAPVFSNKDGPFDLTGKTISMVMQNETDPFIAKNATGIWITDDAANGAAHFEWSDADVAVPGTWKLWITLTAGGKPVHSEIKLLEITEAPVVH